MPPRARFLRLARQGGLTIAPGAAHLPARGRMNFDPGDSIGLDIQQGVRVRLDGIGFLLAAGVDPDRNWLRGTGCAFGQLQIDNSAIVAFDRLALAEELASTGRMAGHQAFARSTYNWKIVH